MPKIKASPKIDKREAILKAAMEIMAENGFNNAPMSLISKRAKASPGIIYHYFESKDELVETVYHRIYGSSLRAFETADNPQAPLPQRFQTLWLSVYQYCFEHPIEIAFLDQYENSPLAQRERYSLRVENMTFDQLLAAVSQPKVLEQLSHEEKALISLMTDLRRQNLIKDLPQAAISEFAVGVPRRLGRQAATGFLKLDKENLSDIAQACWKAIAA